MSQSVTTATAEIAKLRATEGLDRVYVFIVEALYEAVSRVEFGSHVGAVELVEAMRELAVEQYGPLARTVLAHWGIRSTDDVGRKVFEMIDEGMLQRGDSDRIEDYAELFDFEQFFDADYPWSAPVELA